MTRPGQSIVILSLTLAQAQILAERCKESAQRAGVPWQRDPAKEHGIRFPIGSVIFLLPAMPDRVRGYTAHLLNVDEAATIRDEIFTAGDTDADGDADADGDDERAGERGGPAAGAGMEDGGGVSARIRGGVCVQRADRVSGELAGRGVYG